MIGKKFRSLAATVAGGLLVSACAQSAPTRFFVIDPLPPERASPPGSGLAPVRVLAVRLPAAFDREEVVRQGGAEGLLVNDLDRWGAAPETLAREALCSDLLERSPGLVIVPNLVQAPPLTRDLMVNIVSLERRSGEVHAVAIVTITASESGHSEVQVLDLSAPMHGSDAAAQAEALSHLLAQLSDWLAVRFRTAP